MVTQRKPKPSKYLTIPTRPVQVDRDRSIAGLLEKMEGTGFGGRQLAESHRIWLDMLGDNTTIFMAASGALIPAGMRRLLAYVVKNRFVDVNLRLVRRAEEVVIVAHHFLIRADQHERKVVHLVRVEFVQLEHLLHVVQIDEFIYDTV